MILTDKKIRELSEKEGLISPFVEKNLQSESYDVSIGSNITIFKKDIRCLDISDDSVKSIYENITLDDDGYIISPKEYIMIALKETIKLPDNVSAHLRPKTRYTRLGLIVSDQHCNSSYAGQLKIGVFNATNYPIKIRQGFTIAQLVFDELDETPSEHKLYKNKENAHYQNEDDSFRGASFDDQYLDSLWNKILK